MRGTTIKRLKKGDLLKRLQQTCGRKSATRGLESRSGRSSISASAPSSSPSVAAVAAPERRVRSRFPIANASLRMDAGESDADDELPDLKRCFKLLGLWLCEPAPEEDDDEDEEKLRTATHSASASIGAHTSATADAEPTARFSCPLPPPLPYVWSSEMK